MKKQFHILSLLLSLGLLLTSSILNAQSQYVYYGYVPLKIVDGGESTLYIIGNHNETSVQVLSLPKSGVLAEFIIDRLEEKSLTIPMEHSSR